MERKMDKDIDQIPLSQSNVSLKLAVIQKRCTQLLDEPDELTLEEPRLEPVEDGPYDPYDRG
jgi:hypothetical protein